MAETLYHMTDMEDMEPQLRGTAFKGGIRGGGSLTIMKDGALVGVLPANLLTSTVHKAQRRARMGAPLLDLLLQSMIYAVMKRLLASPTESSAKAALTQVVNRFIISFLEEGVLMACSQSAARFLVNRLTKLVMELNEMKAAVAEGHKTIDFDIQQGCTQRALTAAVKARLHVSECVCAAARTPRGRFISVLGADALPQDRPKNVTPLPKPLTSMHAWKTEITEAPYKNNKTRIHYQKTIMDMYNESNDELAKSIAYGLCHMPTEHPEYASMVWRYAFLESQSGPGFFRNQEHAFMQNTLPYNSNQAGLPDGFGTIEEVIDAFGIKDVHTGQGTFAE